MGRDLHEFLEVTTPYRKWFPRMVEYGFSEDQDFRTILSESAGGRPGQDHIISLDMAKEVSMIQRTERGKQARQYFIECERRLKQVQPELTPGCFKGFAFQTRPLLKARFEHKAKTSYYGLILLQRLEPSTYHPTQRGCVGFSNLSS